MLAGLSGRVWLHASHTATLSNCLSACLHFALLPGLQLGTPFAITLEAPHVVDMRRQVWAGVVGSGPGGTQLNVSTVQYSTVQYSVVMSAQLPCLGVCLPMPACMPHSAPSQP